MIGSLTLEHGRVPITLHTVQAGEGEPLLLLHALGEGAYEWLGAELRWRGPIQALDFAGHGVSGRIAGGGYYPEYFLADADLALQAMGGSAVVVGAGIGAYVALLIAGARADAVPGALLLPGRGLQGGGSEPDFDERPPAMDDWEADLDARARGAEEHVDPMVFLCERDLRPTDYVRSFAEAARGLWFSGEVDEAGDPPEWWVTAREVARHEIVGVDFDGALARLGDDAA